MTENEVLDLKLSAHLLRLMLDEKIAFERKKGKMDYLIRVGADVNKKLYGKSMALWVKELGNEKLIKYVKEKGGVEIEMSQKKRDELGKQFWNKDGNKKGVKEIRELVLQGADLSVKNNNDEQIWKNLSFEEMNEVLKDLPKGYMIEEDVDLSKKGLTQLPDFSKIKVGGYFDCSSNRLKDLKGAPSKVGGSFYCHENQLKDLIGAPSVVGGSFYCSENQLTDLKGAPRVVGESFLSSNNQLSSLKGGPIKVGGDFGVNDNKLATLKGAPEVVVRDFLCDRNMLYSLEDAPKIVGGNFWCSWNNLTSLKGAPSKVGGNFRCEGNSLVSLEGAPSVVGGYFDCRKNKLISLKGKPEKLGGEIKIDEEVLRKVEKEKRSKSILERMFAKREEER